MELRGYGDVLCRSLNLIILGGTHTHLAGGGATAPAEMEELCPGQFVLAQATTYSKLRWSITQRRTISCSSFANSSSQYLFWKEALLAA